MDPELKKVLSKPLIKVRLRAWRNGVPCRRRRLLPWCMRWRVAALADAAGLASPPRRA
jgi:hypothetical protein